MQAWIVLAEQRFATFERPHAHPFRKLRDLSVGELGEERITPQMVRETCLRHRAILGFRPLRVSPPVIDGRASIERPWMARRLSAPARRTFQADRKSTR